MIFRHDRTRMKRNDSKELLNNNICGGGGDSDGDPNDKKTR